MTGPFRLSAYRFLSRIPNYVKRFGILKGILYCAIIELPTKESSETIIKLSLPHSKNPYFLRTTRSDRSIFWQCLVQQQYDVRGFPQYNQLVKHYELIISQGKEVHILDCGANIGFSVRELSRMFPLAKIIAIEPDKENIKLLEYNIAGIKDNVKILEAAVWSKECQLTITNRQEGSASYQVAEIINTPSLPMESRHAGDPQSVNLESESQIRAITINKLLKDNSIDELFIAKFDIEGAQKEVFKGETDWLGNVSLTLIELDDWLLPWQGTSRPFISAISKIESDFLLKGELLCVFKDHSQTPQQ